MGVTERKEKEKKELKSLILDTAKRLFVEKGVEQTTIRNIADEIEYSVGTIYVYFKDKNAILYEIHRLFFQVLERRLNQTTQIPDPIERLREIGQQYVAFAFDNMEGYYLIFAMSAPIEHINSVIEDGDWNEGKKVFAILCKAVEECQDAGYFKHEQVETLSLACWAVAHGLCSLYIRNRLNVLNTECIRMEVKNALDTFINAIKR
jgi:AcrR family transcriptional regulator